MTWNTLTEEQYIRLCECRSREADIVPIAFAYMTECNFDADTALLTTLEHLDANCQFFDLSQEEWNKCIDKLNRRMVQSSRRVVVK